MPYLLGRASFSKKALHTPGNNVIEQLLEVTFETLPKRFFYYYYPFFLSLLFKLIINNNKKKLSQLLAKFWISVAFSKGSIVKSNFCAAARFRLNTVVLFQSFLPTSFYNRQTNGKIHFSKATRIFYGYGMVI